MRTVGDRDAVAAAAAAAAAEEEKPTNLTSDVHVFHIRKGPFSRSDFAFRKSSATHLPSFSLIS